MSDLDKLKEVFSGIGVSFVVRQQDDCSYLFIGKPESARDIKWMNDNFEATELDLLLRRNHFFEFENGKLTGY